MDTTEESSWKQAYLLIILKQNVLMEKVILRREMLLYSGKKMGVRGKSIVILMMMLCFSFSLLAQDIHFSQYNSSPMNYNPGLTGFFNGDYRFSSNYRNQWSAIPVD